MTLPLPKPKPNTPDQQWEVDKLEYQTELNLYLEQKKSELAGEATQAKAIEDTRTAAYANEYATYQEAYKAYIDLAKGQIDRSMQRADFVQKVAAAIATAYAAILALSFSVTSTNAGVTPLPVTGIIPTFFLGLAFVLATVYVAFVTKPAEAVNKAPTGILRIDQDIRRDNFILWATVPAMARVHWLQAAVISLGVGVVCLPLPYISIDTTTSWGRVVAVLAIGSIAVGGLTAVLLPPLVHLFQVLRRRATS
jgi:hypothetical protein